MKKVLIIVLSVLLFLSPLFSQNLQKIHPVNSEVYEIITYLYIESGLALPSTSGPYSTDELLKMLDNIDRSSFSGYPLKLYDEVESILHKEAKPFEFSFEAALEAYLHIDKENFTTEQRWVTGYDQRKPLFKVQLDTALAKYFYGYSEIGLGITRYQGFDNNIGGTSVMFGKDIIGSNFFLFNNGFDVGDVDFSIPKRAFAAFGGKNWSVQIGRDKLSWGPGVSGNFMLSDHLKYHNLGRFTAYSNNFKYTLVSSFFPHPQDYYDSSGVKPKQWQGDTISGLNMFLAHRLEWRMFKDKVGFALSEAIMYQSDDNTLDLRILNPSMIYHNYYIRSNANSLLSFELNYTPIKRLNIYGQLAIDEFALVGEPIPGKDEGAFPSAFAYMLGVKGDYPLKEGLLYGSFEFILTDPYLYLRYGTSTDHSIGEAGISYVVAMREYFSGGHIFYDEQFVGYPYGPDAIVLNANVGYKEINKWNIEGNIFLMFHGTHDQWTLWTQVYPDELVDDQHPPYLSTPTKEHLTGNNWDDKANLRDAISKTLAISVKGGYTFIDSLDVYGQLDFINIINPGNRKPNPTIRDLQFTLGVSYKF